MTAAGAMQNSKSISSPNQDQRPREPSMEDILASIRRIIADDQSQAGRGFSNARRGNPPAMAAPPVAEQEPAPYAAEADHHDVYEEVLDLARMPETVVAEAQRHPPAAFADSHDPAPVTHEFYADESQPLSPESHVNGYAPAQDREVRLAPAETDRPSAVHHEAAPVASQSRSIQPSADAAEPLMSPKMGASVMSAFESLAATVVLQNSDMLDQLMHDLMRPLLKTWLDDNLPSVVERLVRAEIERMARGGRG